MGKMKFLKLNLTKITLQAFLAFNQQHACADCTFLSVSSINFGQYNSLDQQPNAGGIGSITVRCNGATSGATVSLSTGSSTTYTNRTLSNGIDQLHYNVYTNPGDGMIWGDGTGGSTTISIPSNTSTSLTLYGVIPARQNISAGFYSDNLLMTVNF
jgi:spore coat protein U-like protein